MKIVLSLVLTCTGIVALIFQNALNMPDDVACLLKTMLGTIATYWLSSRQGGLDQEEIDEARRRQRFLVELAEETSAATTTISSTRRSPPAPPPAPTIV